MSFVVKKLHFKLSLPVFLIFAFFTVSVSAQKRKPVISQKKTPVQTNSKNQSKQVSSKQEKISEKTKQTKADKLKQAKIDEANRAALAARQKALLEEKRRREIAIREAQAKKLAFERSLRTETVENISNDATQGEDLEIRRAAVSALGNRAGTVVVLEPQTGKVLTIVNQDWGIRQSFKPCSTIKLVTAIAGLNENVIDTDGVIRPTPFPVTLNDALAFSNNSYFQKVGLNLGSKRMVYYAQMLGLGQPTGINAENEAAGKLPFGNNNARIYSHGDDFEVTPLQLAVLVSAISNGGKIVVPQIPKDSFQKANFNGYMRRQISLPPQNIQRVIPGMIGAATYGTARRGMDSALDVAGKTGSCIGQGSWVGLFASVAPVENPQFAVVVITRGQGERGKFAAGVAAQIYQSLRNRITRAEDKTLLAQTPVELKPQPKVNAETSALLDDDEDEDSDDAGTIRKGKKAGADSVNVSTTEMINASQIKKTEKNNAKPAANIFSPVVIEVKKSSETETKKITDSGLKRPRIVTNK